jgi:hypothetical protein
MVEAGGRQAGRFVVRQLRLLGEWACRSITQRPGGGAIEYVLQPLSGGATPARSLRSWRSSASTPRDWLVYEYALGRPDVAWYGWWKAYPVLSRFSPRTEHGEQSCPRPCGDRQTVAIKDE